MKKMFQLRLLQVLSISIMASLAASMEGLPGHHSLDINKTGDEKEVQNFMLNNLERISLVMFDVLTISVNYTLPCEHSSDVIKVKVKSNDTDIFEINENDTFIINCSNDEISTNIPVSIGSGRDYTTGFVHGTFELGIKGKLLGISQLDIMATTDSRNDVTEASLSVFVLRKIRVIDKVFFAVVAVFLFVIFIAFGCKLELEVVKKCLKKPIAPGIGLACQYLVMPLLGYGIAVLMPFDNPSIRLGIFVCGVCPGGGISNVFTYLLGGDVSLSITMTFISTMASVAFMPLWIYTLGRTLMDESMNLTIPFVQLLQTIALATIPVLIGVFIKYKFVKAASVIVKLLKPVTAVFMLIFVVIAVISNWYLLKLFKPVYILSGSLLPYMGYLIGGIVPAVLQQPWKRVKTIAIEAGMQNVGVAYILLLWSFPPPLGDIASLTPAVSGMMMPLPGLLVAIPYNIYRKCTKTYDPVSSSEKDPNDISNEDKTNEKIAVEKLSAV